MSKLNIDILNTKGAQVGSIDIPENLLTIEGSTKMIADVVRWQRNAKRAGTHSCLNRATKTKGGRKPHNQKGTGKARAGSRNSPTRVGGAVAFGPTPRDYSFSLNKKTRAKALKIAVSQKFKDGFVKVIDKIEFSEPKTKNAIELLNKLELNSQKVLFIGDREINFVKSISNVQKVNFLNISGINVYDILNANYIVFSTEAFNSLIEKFN